MRISTRRSDLPMGKSLISKVRYLGLFVPVLLLLMSYQTTYSQTCTLDVHADVYSALDCNGDADGKVDVIIDVAGVTPYSYLWSDGQTVKIASNLTAGTYTVTVTDSSSPTACTSTGTVTITDPPPFNAKVELVHAISCYNYSDGILQVDIDTSNNGAVGTSPYFYVWGNSITTDTVENLEQGYYSVIVFDDNGCYAQIAGQNPGYFLAEPPEILTYPSQTNVSCYGGNDGAINLHNKVFGGVSPYLFYWTGSGGPYTTDQISNLIAGNYDLTITDDSGCEKILNFTVTQPSEIIITTDSTTNVECYGYTNGAIYITPSGGAAPYSFSWSTGAVTEDITNVGAGTYIVTVTDASSCTSTASIEVFSNNEIIIGVVKSDILCNGDGNGSIDLSVSGGTTPYSFSWSNLETTEDLSGLSGGTYLVTVTDAIGCIANETIEIIEPEVLTASIVGTNVDCNGNSTGQANLTVSGGTSSYGYLWSNGSVMENLTNVVANLYNVLVTDANGCTVSANVLITQPDELTVSLDKVDVSCYGGSNGQVSTVVQGGTPLFSYAWSNLATTENLTGVTAGTYSVTVTDDNGCTATATVDVDEPSLLTASITPTHVLCHGDGNGVADLIVGGGVAPYTYVWSPNGETTEDLSGLSGGTYSVEVTDANQCIVTADVTIAEPSAISATITSPDCNGYEVSQFGASDGSITAIAFGGTGTLDYLWSNGATTQNLSGLTAGQYCLTVTDDNNCEYIECITLDQPPALLLTLTTATDIICHGDATGAIDITVIGGVPNYSFNWSNSETSEDLVNVPAGTYSVTVTDACGGVQTITGIILSEPSELLGYAIETDILCYGDDDGTIDAFTNNGGVSPYTFRWYRQSDMNNLLHIDIDTLTSTFDQLPNGDGLDADNYCVVISDQNGCHVTRCVLIESPPDLVISLIDSASYPTTPGPYDVSCYGATDGWLDIDVAGGTTPYSYNWGNNYATTQDVGGLWSDAWGVLITDDNGCQYVWQKTLYAPDEIIANVGITGDISCNGYSDGAVEVVVTGGVPGTTFTYSWNPGGATTSAISGLPTGTYCVDVVDLTTGCGVNDSGSGNASFGSEWIYTYPTGSNHTILVPLSTVSIDGTSLIAYDYLGVFFSGSNPMVCAGYAQVMPGDTAVVIVAWGDDGLTPAKDGMAAGEIFTFKVFRPYVGEFGFVNNVGNPLYDNNYDPLNFNDGNYSVVTSLVSNDHMPQSNLCIYLPEPDAVVLSAVATDVDCYGNSTGAIDLTIVGGTTPYSILWSNSETTEDIGGLTVGTYFVSVTDDNGCAASLSVLVTEPDLFIVTGSSINVSCFGFADGSIDVSINGGTLPYTILWSNGAATEDISGLGPDTYIIDVTDANNCTASAQYIITEPAVLSAIDVTTNVSCHGLSDGAVDITVTGGTTPYSFAWSNSTSMEDISGVPAGSYTVTITDANQCELIETYPVTEPDALDIAETLSMHNGFNISCNGGSDGTIDIVVSGGTMAYSYSWSNGATVANLSNLGAGSYTVTVIDANSCVIIETFTLTEPSTIQLSETHVNVDCNGNATGAIDLTALGGVDQFTYLWSNGAVTEDISSLLAGTYTVTVTDANSCIETLSVTITEPTALTLSGVITHVDCYGNSTGAVDITVGGGTLPYTFAWSNSSAMEDISGLVAGSYTLTFSDANGCEIIETYTVTQPDELFVNTSMTPVSCYGGSDGTATATVYGGTSPFTYLWSNAGTDQTITGLSIGVYSVTVTDANNCVSTNGVGGTLPWSFTNTGVNHTIFAPDNVPVEIGGTPIQSGDVIGAFFDDGGTMVCAGYIAWTGGSTAVAAFGNDTYTDPTKDGFFDLETFQWKIWRQFVGEFDAVANYQTPDGVVITHTDQFVVNGQSQFLSLLNNTNLQTVNITSVEVTEPPLLTVVASNDPVVCNGDATNIYAVASGGTPAYTYVWSNTQLGSPMVDVAGTYTVTATDANNCTATASITVSDPMILGATTSKSDVLCFGGNTGGANVVATGGYTPYTYLWSNGGTDATITGLVAATYTVTVTDAEGCTTTADAVVGEPAVLAATASATDVSCFGGSDGSIDLAVTGGTMAYTFLWSNSDTDEDISGLAAGTYNVTVTDANGCTTTASATVGEPTDISISGTLSQYPGGWNISCYGLSDGSINLSVSGGTPGYTYLWSNSETTEDLSNIAAGTYTVSVTDANSCLKTASFTLTEPAELVVTAHISSFYDVTGNGDWYNTTCNGFDGSAYLDVVGGTTAYTYNWNYGATADSIDGIYAGTYNATVTDENGCVAVSNDITLTSPGPYNVVATQMDTLSCYGDCDASINVTWDGGIPPFDIYWSNWNGNPVIDTYGDSIAFPYCALPVNCNQPGFCAGEYWAVVVDSMGCAVLSNIVNVIEPDELILAPGLTNVSCNGLSDGVIDLTGTTGATPPYIFVWDVSTNFATTNLLTGLSAGDSPYVSVWDDAGCAMGQQFLVTEPDVLLITSIVPTDVLCNGDATGELNVTVTGGTPPYNYYVDGNLVGSNANITGLAAGTYDVKVIDANACETVISTATINEPPALAIGILVTDVLCNGGSDGSIDATVSGGVPPYTYAWSNGEATEDVNGLIAGTYDLTITDANGCTEMEIGIIVAEPAALTLAGTATDVSCFGGSDGSIDITVGGGTMPYSYSWSSGDVSEDVNGLVPGTYDVVVTDANLCTISGSYTIVQPVELLLSGVETDVLCNGFATGEVDLSYTGGTGTVTFLWSNSSVTEDISGVAAGTYTVVATDANSCTASASFTITEPTAISVAETITDVSCYGYTDGEISVVVSGGTPAYGLTWSTGSTSNTISGLAAGAYGLTVVDSNGCIYTNSYTVDEPMLLIAYGSTIDVTCPGGSDGEIDLTIDGGTAPYIIDWNTGFASSEDLTGLVSGSYHVEIVDVNGCTTFADFTIYEPGPYVVSGMVTDVSCNGGSDGEIDLSVSGATGPYTYSWSNGEVTEDITGLVAGTYDVDIYDVNMCATSATFTVIEPTALTATLDITDVSCNGGSDGEIEVLASGGTSPYSYNWNVGSGMVNSGLVAGTYDVTVTDGMGCEFSISGTVNEPAVLDAAVDVFETDCSASTGSIAITNISGGTGPFSIMWSTGSSDLVQFNLATGTYGLTITDANGCTYINSYFVGESNQVILSANITDVDCYGYDTGEIDLVVSGGNAPYSYNWMPNGETDEDLTGLFAGTYDVTVEDVNGCVAVETYTVVEGTEIVASVLTADESCFGYGNGQAEVSMSGGSGVYSVEWSTGDVSMMVSGLVPGLYDVTVTDNLGCFDVVAFEIYAAPGIILTLTKTDVECNQDTDGAIDLEVTGGTGSYLYSWDDLAHSTTQDLTNLAAGTYTVMVEDANGCTATGSETIDILDPFVITDEIIVGVSCNSGNDGSVYVEMQGGHFWFEWTDVLGNPVGATPNDTATLLANVPAGEYFLEITLPLYSNCVMNMSYTVTEPDPIVLSSVVTDASCYKLDDGEIDLTVTGGTTPYSYEWTIGASVIPSGEDLIGRKAGIYKVVVTDANGCSEFKVDTIEQPTLMVNTVTTTGVTCNGDADGSVEIISTGGTAPYAYAWSGSLSGNNPQNLSGGLYTVTITDDNGCISIKDADVHEPDPLSVSVTSTDLTCFGSDNGEATADTIGGGTFPYSFLWSNSGTNEGIENLSAGVYSVTIGDAHYCATSAEVTVDEPANLVISISETGGIATASAVGGTTPYAFAWSNGINGPSTPIASGQTLTCTVTDANGCTDIGSITSPTPPTITNNSGNGDSEADVPFADDLSNLEKDVNVYPNPSTDGHFIVDFSNIDLTGAQLQVVDGFGKVLDNKMIVDPITRQIELQLQVSKGVYYLKIITENRKVITKSLVITE